jgi:peptidoglycan/LPS O-acetylase OafA/YrhL
MQGSDKVNRIFGLDLMRAMAIFMVVVGHTKWIYPNLNGVLSSVFDVFAFLGVEIFFVLSGFLIGKILYNLFVIETYDFNSFKWFLKRRWWRTLPGYYLILSVNVILALILFPTTDSLLEYFYFGQNFCKSMPGFYPESWSLSVEEFSYLFLALVLFFASWLKRKTQTLNIFLAVVLVLMLISWLARVKFYFETHNTDLLVWNSLIKSSVIHRLDSIYLGVLAYWFSVRLNHWWIRFRWIFAFLGFLLLAFMFVGVGYFRCLIDNCSLFWNVFYLPLVSLSVAFFLPLLSGWKSTISMLKITIEWISIRSYSMYLLHYSLLLQLMKTFWVVDPAQTLRLHIFTLCYLLLVLISSHFFYKYYEKPLMDFREKS